MIAVIEFNYHDICWQSLHVYFSISREATGRRHEEYGFQTFP